MQPQPSIGGIFNCTSARICYKCCELHTFEPWLNEGFKQQKVQQHSTVDRDPANM